MQSQDNTLRGRLTASYITSVVSITLVLFVLGMIGLLLLNARKLSDYVKENIGFSVFLNSNIREVEVFNLQKILDSKPYVKETRYITKDQAAEEFQKELGEDFVDFLGYNPLPASIDVKLNANWANPDSIAVIETEIRSYEQVTDIAYQKDLVYAVNNNIRKISLGMLIFCMLLFVIAVTLISNTIRLTVYSKRFLIRTMQLVGASSRFIRGPFIIKGIAQGIIASFCSFLMLAVILYFAEKQLEGIFSFLDYPLLMILLFFILLTGVLIAWFSTVFSVNKYLNMKTDQLYT